MPISPTLVSLQQITAETVRSITQLSAAESQKGFVAANAVSLAQALFSPKAWYHASTSSNSRLALSCSQRIVVELSYVPGPGCPEPFYLGIGFRHTGRVDGNEIILEYPLHESAT
jgi:diamine N-acetyltransferase